MITSPIDVPMAARSSKTQTARTRRKPAVTRTTGSMAGAEQSVLPLPSDSCRWVDSRSDCNSVLGYVPSADHFSDCRRIARSNPWVGTITRLRVSLANYGLRLRLEASGSRSGRAGATGATALLDEPVPVATLGVAPTWRQYLARFIRQVWRERWTLSNAVMFAGTGENGGVKVPPITLAPEFCTYQRALGMESLIYTSPRVTEVSLLRQLEQLPERLRKSRITVSPDDGEIAVVWRALDENTASFDLPEMRQVFLEASEAEAMSVGEHLIAGGCRTPTHLHLLGYEIKSGPLAGMNHNHARKERTSKLVAERTDPANLNKLRESVRNFDYKDQWVYPPSDLFDVRRWDAVRLRLAEWAGPLGVALLLSARNQATAPSLMRLLQAEMEAERQALKDLLEPFLQAATGVRVRIHWGLRCFQDARVWSELLKNGLSAGPIGQQTYNEECGRDDDFELERKQTERKQVKDRLPLFDAAHGDLPAAGSRKPGKPNGRPPGTQDPEPGE